MPPFMQQLLIALTAGGMLAPLVGVLVYMLVAHWFNKDLNQAKEDLRLSIDTRLEAAKESLRLDSEFRIEGYKAEMHRRGVEHQIQFARIDAQRAEVIAKVFELLEKELQAAKSYVAIVEFAGGPSKAERREVLSKALGEFNAYFSPRRLYLSKSLAAKISRLDNHIWELSRRFRDEVELSQSHTVSAWSEIWEAVQTDSRPLLAELEDSFRQLLGVEHASDDQPAAKTLSDSD